MASSSPSWARAQSAEWLEFLAEYEQAASDSLAPQDPDALAKRAETLRKAWPHLSAELRLALHSVGFASPDELVASHLLRQAVDALTEAIALHEDQPSYGAKVLVNDRAKPVSERLRCGKVHLRDFPAVTEVMKRDEAMKLWLAHGNTAIEWHRQRDPGAPIALDDTVTNGQLFPVGRWLVEAQRAARLGVISESELKALPGLRAFLDQPVTAVSVRAPRLRPTRDTSRAVNRRSPDSAEPPASPAPEASTTRPAVGRPDLTRFGAVSEFVRAGMDALRNAGIELEHWHNVEGSDVALRSGGHVTVKVELPDGQAIGFGDWLDQLAEVRNQLTDTERVLLDAHGIEVDDPTQHRAPARNTSIGR
ncbi:MAG: hypothetical protein ACOYNI_01350 [Acidimicrobiia bacterium]